MTNNGRLATGEIHRGRDLINSDLGYDEVVHILVNPISTETVHIHEDLDDIGIGLPLGSQGSAEIAHILGRINLGTQSPQRRGGLEMPPWML